MIQYRRQYLSIQRNRETHADFTSFFLFLLAIQAPEDEQYKFNISSTGPIPGT